MGLATKLASLHCHRLHCRCLGSCKICLSGLTVIQSHAHKLPKCWVRPRNGHLPAQLSSLHFHLTFTCQLPIHHLRISCHRSTIEFTSLIGRDIIEAIKDEDGTMERYSTTLSHIFIERKGKCRWRINIYIQICRGYSCVGSA